MALPLLWRITDQDKGRPCRLLSTLWLLPALAVWSRIAPSWRRRMMPWSWRCSTLYGACFVIPEKYLLGSKSWPRDYQDMWNKATPLSKISLYLLSLFPLSRVWSQAHPSWFAWCEHKEYYPLVSSLEAEYVWYKQRKVCSGCLDKFALGNGQIFQTTTEDFSLFVRLLDKNSEEYKA